MALYSREKRFRRLTVMQKFVKRIRGWEGEREGKGARVYGAKQQQQQEQQEIARSRNFQRVEYFINKKFANDVSTTSGRVERNSRALHSTLLSRSL